MTYKLQLGHMFLNMWLALLHRAPMVLRVRLELQDREASWDFLVREESVACLDFQDLVYVSPLVPSLCSSASTSLPCLPQLLQTSVRLCFRRFCTVVEAWILL